MRAVHECPGPSRRERRKPAPTWAFLALLAGCDARDPATLLLPEGLAQSVIVAFSDSITGPWSLGAERSGATRLYLTGLGETTEVVLLTYDETLEALGAHPGLLELAPPACHRSCALRSPKQALRIQLRESLHRGERVPGGWESLPPGPLPPELERALIPDVERCSPCAEVRKSTLRIDRAVEVAFTAADVDHSGLVVLRNGDIFRVTSATSAELLCRGTGPEIWSGSLDAPRRTLWLIGRGLFARLDLSAVQPQAACPLVPVGPALPNRVQQLVTDPGGDAAYALSSTGTFARFDGARWSPLAVLELTQPDQVRGFSQYNALVALGPGRAVATAGYNQLAFYEGEAPARIEPVSISGPLAPHVQAIVDGGSRGLILGVDNVGLVRKVVRDWLPFDASRSFSTISFLVDTGDRYVFGTGQGAIVQATPNDGYCPETDLGVSRAPIRAAALSSQAILIGGLAGTSSTAPTEVLWLDLVHACPTPAR